MRRTLLMVATMALTLLVTLVAGAALAAQDKTMTVSIENFAFDPPNMTVAPGTTVTWVNNDQTAHTVTANNGAFDSGTLQPGQSYSFAFDQAGTYAYHCNIHPDMIATVTVSGASGSVGGPGDDTLTGTNGADNLSGMGGDDRIFGLRGNDNLLGGSGKDVVVGGNEDIRPLGGNKNVGGGSGNDWVLGGLGSDNLLGGRGNDFLGNGPFVFHESAQDNFLGGAGNDVLEVINTPAAKDVVTCGGGYDRVFADRKDVVVNDCERVVVGIGNFDAFYGSVPQSFFEGLPPLL
jgi:plastocyanin